MSLSEDLVGFMSGATSAQSSPRRVNPFNNELPIDESHYKRADRSCWSVAGNEWGAEVVSDAELGLGSGERLEELEVAMETCKDLVRAAEPHTAHHRALVAKLVALRLQAQHLKEAAETQEDGDGGALPRSRTVSAHRFLLQARTGRNPYCERCQGIIWRLVQPWYRCKVCGYRTHAKCMELVRRTCAGVVAKRRPGYILSICPEKGLAAQKYRCAECRCRLALDGEAGEEARLCDYTGLYFCPACHWNDTALIPARVVHDWDFTPRPVARSSKQLLHLLSTLPLLNLDTLNPALFNHLQELRLIRKLRKDILVMKCYFVVCERARKERILWALRNHQHFVETAERYSLADLAALQAGTLETELRAIIGAFADHICRSCLSCAGKGFVCEVCAEERGESEVLYPFDDYVAVCGGCGAVFHRRCRDAVRGDCPRCLRRRERAQKESPPSPTPSSSPGYLPIKSCANHKEQLEIFTSEKLLQTVHAKTKPDERLSPTNPFNEDSEDEKNPFKENDESC